MKASQTAVPSDNASASGSDLRDSGHAVMHISIQKTTKCLQYVTHQYVKSPSMRSTSTSAEVVNCLTIHAICGEAALVRDRGLVWIEYEFRVLFV